MQQCFRLGLNTGPWLRLRASSDKILRRFSDNVLARLCNTHHSGMGVGPNAGHAHCGAEPQNSKSCADAKCKELCATPLCVFKRRSGRGKDHMNSGISRCRLVSIVFRWMANVILSETSSYGRRHMHRVYHVVAAGTRSRHARCYHRSRRVPTVTFTFAADGALRPSTDEFPGLSVSLDVSLLMGQSPAHRI